MASIPSPVSRFHALDHLRAIMMILGIWIHGTATYAATALDPVWYPKDPRTSLFFDYAFFAIHSFRMPLFFVLAGFFANLLYRRYGAAAFLRQRFRRIFLPFVFGWLLFYIPSVAGIMYSLYAFQPNPAASVLRYFKSAEAFHALGTLHLWFLYYLVFFYVGAVLMSAMVRRVFRTSAQHRVDRHFRAFLSAWWAPIALAFPTLALLALMRTPTIDTSDRFLIPPRMLAIYALFFGFGWTLFRHADLLPTFQRFAWTRVGLAAILLPLQIRAELAWKAAAPLRDPSARWVALIGEAFVAWLLIFGLTGLFLRYASRESPRVRYLADASYWMYVAHLPLVVWIQIPLLYWNVSPWIKSTIVLAATLSILLVTYEWGVRYTLIGTLLNGSRTRSASPDRAAFGFAQT